ncbi:MAG: hypothetical protein K2N56_00040 [Oscillospiraceae bacterium]|nr:hypothetical protein [Oscillospiraceae bacterium]
MALEYQRYGRNKDTIVNKTYIESGEYRRKFDNATDNPDVNKALYNAAKTALIHRSGTKLEDMYWFDGKTGQIISKEINAIDPRIVIYSDKTKSAIKSNDNIIALHTHPSSMQPSVDDFNACCRYGYRRGVVACHNGKVFIYYSEQLISSKLYEMVIERGIKDGLSEYDAQIAALNSLKRSYNIDFWEVK